MASFDFSPDGIIITLDGVPVEIPSDRTSFSAIRSHLDRLALQQQRLLCWISVDGQAVNLTRPGVMVEEFERLEAETMGLNQVPAQLIRGALCQTEALRTRVQSALEMVLINDAAYGRELWWNVSTALKEPLLTLSLVPDPNRGTEDGPNSMMQLRKWQLQQLGDVIRDIDSACESEEPATLAEALEDRALPWLDQLQKSLELWHDSVASEPVPHSISEGPPHLDAE